MWGIILSDPLPVVGLVGSYPTNYLMGRSPPLKQPKLFSHQALPPVSLCGLSCGFPQLSRAPGQVRYVLLTRAPLSSENDRSTCMC